MLPRPWIVLNCCRSCCSLTALAVGSTELGCCAAAGYDDIGQPDERQSRKGVAKIGDKRRHVAFLPDLLVARYVMN